MKELQTILGTDVPLETRSILYLAEIQYLPLDSLAINKPRIKITKEIFFKNRWDGINAYSNIPNPASQLIEGNTYDELIKNMHTMHKHLNDPEWVDSLIECL